MYVLTIDQRASRTVGDQVDDLLAGLARYEVVLPFERTAGDEVQGVLDSASEVTRLVLSLVRSRRWTVGIGLGPVREPLPASTRAGAGPGFTMARSAVTRAKRRPSRVAVEGLDSSSARHAQTCLDLIASLYGRRSALGWAAVDLADQGLTGTEISARLGISKQAVSQRLSAAEWYLEADAGVLAASLLAAAEATSDASRR